MRLLSKALLISLLSLATLPAHAFVVRNIEVDGLQGVSKETVLNYLPVQVGDEFNTAQSGGIIRSLYDTGFFSDVSVAQKGNTLVIHVVERPVIAFIDVSGNKTIPKEKLNEVLKQLGLVQGQLFDNATLERVKRSLETEYANSGKYTARIETKVTQEPRNRVAVRISISEGRTAQVADIRISGNHAFSSKKLIHELTLSTPHIWSFINRADQYSQEKLDSSLDALRSYYMDRGYLKFKVDSAQATLTPDRKHVYLVIQVTEGAIYKVKGYQLSGNLVLPQTKLEKLIKVHAGDVFSRKNVKDSTDAISKALGDMGYAFANITVDPAINEEDKTVFINFYVDPGNRIYVRRINFSGNTKTEDSVLRHSVRQTEGGLISTSDVKETERLLNLTGYLTDVHADTQIVPGTTDQVDLDYKVTEGPSAQAIAGVGYGTDGFVVNAGINQSNFLGTGKTLGLNFQNSKYSTDYSINYNDPFYTPDGIQRGFNLYAQKTTPGNLGITNYKTDVYGGMVNYSIPISSKGDFWQLGFGYQDVLLTVGSDPADQIVNFANEYGRHFNEVLLNTGWSRNGLDKAILPTQGFFQEVSINFALPGSTGQNLNYYKATYNTSFYQPITSGFIFTTRSSLGYGNGFGSTQGLPFFANYYAGGIGYNGQVRGYEANSLGPQETVNGVVGDGALGGNELVSGSAAIIFPNPLSADKLRTSVFVDGGNVYSTQSRDLGGTGSGPVRFSTGLAVDWQVPILNVMLNLSYAVPLNSRPGDKVEHIQFNIGTSF